LTLGQGLLSFFYLRPGKGSDKDIQPMKTLLLKASLFCCLISLAACTKEKTPAAANPTPAVSGVAPAPSSSPDTVVATINDQKITAADLDEQLKPQMKEMEEQMQRQKFQMRRQGLDQMILQRLVNAEASKKGVTQEQYLKVEIDDKVAAPSAEKIKEFFDQNSKSLPPGSKLEDFKARIVDILTRNQKQERAKVLFDQLRKENKVVVKLEEPRKAVEATGPSRGPSNAAVTVVEFSDFECPYCSRARETVDQMMQDYAGKVRLVFRQFPLVEMHKNAEKAAEASLCANEQGKFWEYHDVLFKNQQKLEVAQLKQHAGEVGLDAAQFTSCLDSGKHKKDVDQDMAAGQKLGVPGTPTVFVNGIMLSSASKDEFKRVIDQELASR